MKGNWIAGGILVLLIGAAVSLALGGGWLNRQGIVMHARMAETGGWTPENLTASVGQPLHLRLTSDDVLHGFALGQSDQPAVDIRPGEISEVTLTFDRPGKYTYYCTRWCGANHWRMRGVIEVTDPAGASTAGPEPEKQEQPLYADLGLDIDSEHTVQAPLPLTKPSAQQGAALSLTLPEELTSQDAYLTLSPEQAFQTIKAAPGLNELSDQEIWNITAALWNNHITRQDLENGRQLYAANCAACHGEQGGGDGVFAAEIAPPELDGHSGMAPGEMAVPPTDFTGAAQMLSASSAHLQGKITRGGMGTGMPYWGPIFTGEQTWDLVAFLWSFQFDLEVKE